MNIKVTIPPSTLEGNEHTVIINRPEGVSISDFGEAVRSAALAIGYHPQSVSEEFPTEAELTQVVEQAVELKESELESRIEEAREPLLAQLKEALEDNLRLEAGRGGKQLENRNKLISDMQRKIAKQRKHINELAGLSRFHTNEFLQGLVKEAYNRGEERGRKQKDETVNTIQSELNSMLNDTRAKTEELRRFLPLLSEEKGGGPIAETLYKDRRVGEEYLVQLHQNLKAMARRIMLAFRK
jgi:hypothetical protein